MRHNSANKTFTAGYFNYLTICLYLALNTRAVIYVFIFGKTGTEKEN